MKNKVFIAFIACMRSRGSVWKNPSPLIRSVEKCFRLGPQIFNSKHVETLR